MLSFNENPNNYHIINHIDGDKDNNNFTNLEWCSQKYNIQESWRLGLSNSESTKIYCEIALKRSTTIETTFCNGRE